MTEFSITYSKTTFDYAYIEKLFNQGMMIDTILTEIQESREHDTFYTGRQHLLDFDRTNSMYHIQSIIDEINDKGNGCCVYSGTTTYYIVANHKVKIYMNKGHGDRFLDPSKIMQKYARIAQNNAKMPCFCINWVQF